MKWVLISEETYQLALNALRARTHARTDHNCPDGWDDCTACNGDELRARAAYELDIGAHVTNCVPMDYNESTS
jgi:hypothetical protein